MSGGSVNEAPNAIATTDEYWLGFLLPTAIGATAGPCIPEKKHPAASD
jgi:hypothetical protein